MRLLTVWTHFLSNLMSLGSEEVHQLRYVINDYTKLILIMSFCKSSSIGGVAHLVNFKGTDTLSALVMARYDVLMLYELFV